MSVGLQKSIMKCCELANYAFMNTFLNKKVFCKKVVLKLLKELRKFSTEFLKSKKVYMCICVYNLIYLSTKFYTCYVGCLLTG